MESVSCQAFADGEGFFCKGPKTEFVSFDGALYVKGAQDAWSKFELSKESFDSMSQVCLLDLASTKDTRRQNAESRGL
jgi:hypothetical protein